MQSETEFVNRVSTAQCMRQTMETYPGEHSAVIRHKP